MYAIALACCALVVPAANCLLMAGTVKAHTTTTAFAMEAEAKAIDKRGQFLAVPVEIDGFLGAARVAASRVQGGLKR